MLEKGHSSSSSYDKIWPHEDMNEPISWITGASLSACSPFAHIPTFAFLLLMNGP